LKYWRTLLYIVQTIRGKKYLSNQWLMSSLFYFIPNHCFVRWSMGDTRLSDKSMSFVNCQHMKEEKSWADYLLLRWVEVRVWLQFVELLFLGLEALLACTNSTKLLHRLDWKRLLCCVPIPSSGRQHWIRWPPNKLKQWHATSVRCKALAMFLCCTRALSPSRTLGQWPHYGPNQLRVGQPPPSNQG